MAGRLTLRTSTLRPISAALICAACAADPKPPEVLENGTSLWRRFETEHFVVESNAPSERKVLEIAIEFEVLWHAFASVPVLGLRAPSEKPIVVVLRSEGEYRFLAGGGSAGLFIEQTVLGPMIQLPPNSSAFAETAIKHELAHFIASGSLKNSPEWLQEGLAQVMETASYDTRKGEILFGRHSEDRVHGAAARVPAYILTAPWPDLSGIDAHRYYGRSWLLVHYLIDYDLRGFLNFLVRVRNGEEWQTAWSKEIFLKLDEIDDALDRYHGRAKYGLWTVRAELPDLDAIEASIVAPADALALRSVLHAYASNPARDPSEKQQAADVDLRAAHDLDPSSPRVRQVSAADTAARDGSLRNR
jgi:hypothetical protein